ncbi:MAG: TlpA disulfide reductase family protein [Bacteroidota bacterium]
MKFLKSFLLLMCIAIATGLSAQKTLPSVEVKTLNGETINIQEFAKNGKITVFSFWATWCSPCKRELDAISEIYEDWQEEFDMELVAITIDDPRALAKVKPMVKSKGWQYTILSDVKEDLKRSLNFQTIPMTFLIDQKGNIVYTHNGYAPGDEYELEDKIKALAGK